MSIAQMCQLAADADRARSKTQDDGTFTVNDTPRPGDLVLVQSAFSSENGKALPEGTYLKVHEIFNDSAVRCFTSFESKSGEHLLRATDYLLAARAESVAI